MPFLDHLEELRWCILWSLIAIVIGAIAGFVVVHYFEGIEWLIRPVRAASGDPDLRLQYLSPADPFFVTLKLAIYSGIILALPVVGWQFWRFLSPAMEPRERRLILPSLYFGVILFLMGVALAYFVALPVTLEFFERFQEGALTADLEINRTLGFVVKVLLGFGVVFELPIVIVVLSFLGLVTPEGLRSKRRHAVVAITATAAFITPGDVISLTLMLMVPLILLYELSILLSILIYRGKRRAEEKLEDMAPAAGSVEAG